MKKKESLNPGCFRSLLSFAGTLNKDVSDHLENSTVFKGNSATIQNEILECVLQVYKNKVIAEVSEAPFIAVIADETTDVSVQNQLTLVIRYIHNCKVVERFWGFFKPDRVNADGIANVILEELEKILKGDKKKVVAQTYDGASVMRGRIGGVHVKVKQVYENAHYVHCAAHQLNLILSKAASCNKEAKLFFAKLDQIPSFFSKSPDRRSAVELNIPSGSKTRWNYNSKTVLRVSLNRQELLSGFNIFVDNPERFGFTTIAAAENCIRALNDDDFNFWLKLFLEIMPAVEILYNVMQCTDLTVQKVEQHLQNFQDAVNSIRNSSSTNNVKKAFLLQQKKSVIVSALILLKGLSFQVI